MARARQKLLKFTFQDFGIDGLRKSRLRWLVLFFVFFFRMDGKTIEHISLLGHSSGCFFFSGVRHFVVTFLISGSGPFEKALQNRCSTKSQRSLKRKQRRQTSLAKAALSYHLSPVVAAKNGA